MNREKCKGCEWYGKPYWSVYNPCDNCPRDNIQVMTRWVDPTIEQLQQELNQKNKIIEEIKAWLFGEKMMFYKGEDGSRLIRYNEVCNKIRELEKGSEE